MSRGKPCSRTTSLRNSSASCGAVTSIVVDAKCAIFVRRSTNTTMALWPWRVRGSGPIRSSDTDCQGSSGTGRDSVRPGLACCESLTAWQV